ncbi:hypothetical protein HYU18_02930 [Candidatus Woesearchaeota archaeon]|nr:hypothetical protein [Candidatus Woesearchaeota archaeon]
MVGAAAGVIGAAAGGGGWQALFARLGQGLRNVGSGHAPALAGSIGQGFSAGAGFAAGQLVAKPIQGVAGWVLNWLPENIAGFMMWGGVVLFWLDWKVFGFNIGAASYMHLLFAVVAFIAFGVALEFMNIGVALSAAGLLVALTGLLNAESQIARIPTIFALVVAFYFYWRLTAKFMEKPGADFFRYLPLIAFVDVYGMPIFRDRVVESVGNLAGSFGAMAYSILSFIFNRLLFPLWIYFPAATLYNNTRVARRIFISLLIFYFIAALPTVTSVYHAKVSSLTPEEKEVAESIWSRFQTNAGRILRGDFLKAPVAAAYERAEQIYGFGEPEEGPKIGLQLTNDPNMPSSFNLNFNKNPTPGVVLDVPNPLPDDAEKRYIEVVGISCSDPAGEAEGALIEPVTAEELKQRIKQTPPKPLLVSYGRPITAKCEFEGGEPGARSVEFDVKYSFKADGYLSTAFMRSDKLDALITAKDPNVMKLGLKDVPPAEAKHDNGPVAIRWGPVELANPPVRIDIEGAKSSGFVIYIARSGGWEGEIGGISKLALTTPKEISLDLSDERCGEIFTADTTKGRYEVREGYLTRDGTANTEDPGNLKFVGESLPFECKIILSNTAFDVNGDGVVNEMDPDWVGATFRVSVDYLFSTKRSVSFDVKGADVKVADSPPATGAGET